MQGSTQGSGSVPIAYQWTSSALGAVSHQVVAHVPSLQEFTSSLAEIQANAAHTRAREFGRTQADKAQLNCCFTSME